MLWTKGRSARKLSGALQLKHTLGLVTTPFRRYSVNRLGGMHGRLKGPEEIQAVFQRAGVDLKQPLVTSCGTGVTASVLALALHQLSPNPQVHDMQNTMTLQNCIPGNIVGDHWAIS